MGSAVRRNKFLRTQILPGLGSTLIRLLCSTLRWKFVNQTGHDSFTKESMLFAFWHNRIMPLTFFYERFINEINLLVLISMSRDGQLIADIAEKFGLKAIRGSSSKKGTSAFLQLIHELKNNSGSVAITPDGPRGPRYEIQDGLLTLARTSHLPITPITCDISRKWEINSWDR
ncbi:MAG: lysophospholipid acyltransferase family protein, partial [Verrucomicrobiota bacterium]